MEDSGGWPALARAANGDLILVHGTVWETVPTGGAEAIRCLAERAACTVCSMS